MSRFRTQSVGSKTENLAGGEAYKESPKLELISILLSSFVQDKFYKSAEEELDRLSDLVKTIPEKEFIGKSAVYARQTFGMRSITHALIGELVTVARGEKWLKNAIAKTVRRPDDMLEMLAYYEQRYGTKEKGKYKSPIPNSMKKGFDIALGKFDEYQLAKYKGSKKSLKLVDLINAIHYKPTDKNKEAIAKLMKDELKADGTWEKELTQAGQEASKIENKDDREKKLKELKSENWGKLISEKKLGYFALLRNLRNILQDAPEFEEKALEMLVDENLIKKSLVLPFRFSTAMKELEQVDNSRNVISALSKALDISVANVPKLDGKTLVVLDESGSMGGKPIEIGALFAAVLYKSNNADLMLFSDTARYKNLNPTDSVITLAERIKADLRMNGTNFNAPFETADKKYDRIVLLSDMQGWIEDSWSYSSPNKKAFPDYCKRTGASPFIYSFDLQGYGTLEFPENKVFCIAGWSEKVFDIMSLLEQDRNALINEIDKIVL